MILLFAFVSFLAVATSLGVEYGSVHHRDHVLRRQAEGQADNDTEPLVPSYNISIPIDHFTDAGLGMYDNRYFINDTYYQPGGPVFFYDKGESGISPTEAAEALAETNGTTAVMALARQYNGFVILWEHRYYGLSLPFPMVRSNATLTNAAPLPKYEPQGAPESWQYLTIDQALEDVVYFANNLETGQYQNENMDLLSPKRTPWIWVGGSYSGDRGAWLRQRNPEIIHATWSSSPPTQAMFNGHTFFDGVLRSLPSNCSTDSQAMIAYIDSVLSGEQGEEELLKLQRLAYVDSWLPVNLTYFSQVYNISKAQEAITPAGVATILEQPFITLYQSFGFDYTTRIFCDALESYAPGAAGQYQFDDYVNILTNPGTSQPSPPGFLAQYNGNLSLGMEAMMYATRVFEAYITTLNLDLQDDTPYWAPNAWADATAWQYQAATQFGWYQGSDPENVTIVSRYRNVSHVQQVTQEFDFDNATLAQLPDRPRVAEINKYGGWNINPSNTMFTDGEFDPWRAGTVYSLESQIGAPGNVPTTEIPACGQSSKNGTRYGAIYPGQAHQPDLFEAWYLPQVNASDSPLRIGLDLFTKALDVWLPCFGQDEDKDTDRRRWKTFDA